MFYIISKGIVKIFGDEFEKYLQVGEYFVDYQVESKLLDIKQE